MSRPTVRTSHSRVHHPLRVKRLSPAPRRTSGHAGRRAGRSRRAPPSCDRPRGQRGIERSHDRAWVSAASSPCTAWRSVASAYSTGAPVAAAWACSLRSASMATCRVCALDIPEDRRRPLVDRAGSLPDGVDARQQAGCLRAQSAVTYRRLRGGGGRNGEGRDDPFAVGDDVVDLVGELALPRSAPGSHGQGDEGDHHSHDGGDDEREASSRRYEALVVVRGGGRRRHRRRRSGGGFGRGGSFRGRRRRFLGRRRGRKRGRRLG